MNQRNNDEIQDLCHRLSNLQANPSIRSRPPKQKITRDLKYRNRHGNVRPSEGRATSSASSDSSYVGETYSSLPTKTSVWDIYCLESLGIYYNSHFHSMPSDILDMVFNKTGVFGPLTEEQKEYVENLQNSVTYSCSITEILGVLNMVDVENFIPEMKKDVDNIRNHQVQSQRNFFAPVVEDFIVSTRLMIKYQISHITQDFRKGPVPEVVFVDMFKAFVKMCGLLPIPGSVWKSQMCIQDITVKSEADVVIMPNAHLDDESTDTVSVASIVTVKNLTLYTRANDGFQERKTRPVILSDCSSASHDSEPHEQPAIYKRIGQKVLGQHGGELLLHHELYGKKLSKGRALKYLPGMIVIGTEVTFTLLELNADHVRELETKYISERNKGYIYYSEPKDLLKKEDRDLLLEAFARLSNPKHN